MMYFPEYDFVFLDIFKNGSNVFSRLFEYVLGSKGDGPNFIREPNIYISVVRNPYDRVVSQFYNHNRGTILKQYRYTIHYPFFRRWIEETYSGKGYTGDDGHLYSQSHIIQYYENSSRIKIFKMEEFKPHEIFFFLDLTDEQKFDIDNKFSEIRAKLDLNGHHTTTNIKQGIWQVYHTSETIAVCNEFFTDDFKFFDYPMLDPTKWETPKRSVL